MNKKVAVYLAEGFEEIEAISIIDILRRAEIETDTISISGERLVPGAHNISVQADLLFEDADNSSYDMIVLPGGMPGTEHLNDHKGLTGHIMEYHNKGKYLAAICAAPMVFGNLGILKGKSATCFPGFEKYLSGANVTGADVEQSGAVITGKGAGVAIKFALKIVEILRNKSFADELAEAMIVH